MALQMLRPKDAIARRGVKSAKHYRDIADEIFTPPVRIGARAVAWPEYELDALNGAYIAGKSDAAIRELVKRLMAARSRVVGKSDAEIRELVKRLVAESSA